MVGDAALLQGVDVTVDRRPVLRGLDLRVGAGERVALLGASGAGKSVTASLLLAQISPRFRVSGRLAVLGREVPLRRGRLARVPTPGVAAVQQDSATALNPLLVVGRQLALALSAPGAADTGVAELLTRVGLDPAQASRRYPAELSGGQRQRVCLALALARRPRLLVADEPTTALDVVTERHVLAAVEEVVTGTGAALLLICHDLAVAARLCDRAVVLAEGRVVADLAVADLLRQPPPGAAAELVVEARRREVVRR